MLSGTLEPSKEGADELIQAEILSSMADVSRKQGDSDLSLSRHKQALKHYIAQGHARWAARTYNNIGYLLRRKNERAKALEAYGEVEAILADSEDDELINSQPLARALISLGRLTVLGNTPWRRMNEQQKWVMFCSMLVPKGYWADTTQG